MSSAEFSMWVKLIELDPWDEHVDLGFGTVAANQVNWSGKVLQAAAEPAQPADFMPLPRVVVQEPDPLKFFGPIK